MTVSTTRGGLRDITNTSQEHELDLVNNKQVLGNAQLPNGASQLDPKDQVGGGNVKRANKRRSVSGGHNADHASKTGAGGTSSSTASQPSIEQPLSDPQEVEDYARDIYTFLCNKEKTDDMRINSAFLEGAAEVSTRMRGILLDWLIEVHYKFKLLPETLYLCVNLIDRYLQRDRAIPKRRLQLMGGTCMLIAAKYEEYRPPEVKEICYIMDNAYKREDVLEMEVQILNTLKFSITSASPLQFLDFYAKGYCARESEIHSLAQFCLECCITDPVMNSYLPSQLAGVALYAAERMMQGKVGTPVSDNATPATPGSCSMKLLSEMEEKLIGVIEVQKDKALGKKYAKERYKNVMQYVRRSFDMPCEQ
ncbi:unnamed protein product [Amoebophrya sp. A120]|nr:unnamed protein product [Amoebophrya sp. A120]|eukprot:GSA120T00023483001.1